MPQVVRAGWRGSAPGPMRFRGREAHHGDMSTATFHHPAAGPGRGATATGAATHHSHRIGDALRAVKVFAIAAVEVVILGEYGEEAGVVRRHR